MGEYNQPIRVLQIIGSVCGGGVETVIMNYYRNINRTKVQFDFVIEGSGNDILEEEIRFLGGKIYKVESLKKNFLKYMYQIYLIVKKNNYKIVHSNMNTLSIFSLSSAWAAGAPIRILHNHSTAEKKEIIRSAIKYILRPLSPLFANKYVACSRAAAYWMYGYHMVDTGKVKIVNNAINTKKFHYDPIIRKKIRKELNISNDTLVIGHVGRFMYQKNHTFIIDIFNNVHKREKKSILLLIGDGELRYKIENKVKNYNLVDSVVFLGIKKNVYDLYNVMDVFLLPSWYEGLPVVSIEAQTNGLRCMLSDRITRESKLTHSVEFYDLDKTAQEWANELLNKDNKRNEFAGKDVSKADFDIIKEADRLLRWYMNENKKYID